MKLGSLVKNLRTGDYGIVVHIYHDRNKGIHPALWLLRCLKLGSSFHFEARVRGLELIS